MPLDVALVAARGVLVDRVLRSEPGTLVHDMGSPVGLPA
jgi:hypothetical protein